MTLPTLLVNKLHAPVTVLGPGRRIGIWLQGCRIRCTGCVSRDTWEFDRQRAMPVQALVDWCAATIRAARQAGEPLTGITVSGGEPFDQADDLACFVDLVRRTKIVAARDDTPALDLLCYSGYPLATLQAAHADLLARLDALIPEAYVDALPLTHRWRGSANQPLVPLSELGRVRYAAHLDAPTVKEMQVALDGGWIWFIGLPDRGDMPRLEALCRARGVDFAQVSWRR